MKKLLLFAILILALGGLFFYYYQHNPYFQHQPVTQSGRIANMIIQSSAFKNGEPIPSKYTCDGENINPPLTLNNVPYGTKSLVLIMDDPDSPSKDFTHWVMFNIEPNTTDIPENFTSKNVTQGRNDFGNNNYGGPCPQVGTHNYSIKLYAINSVLLLQRGVSKAQVLENIKGQILETAELIGSYKKI